MSGDRELAVLIAAAAGQYCPYCDASERPCAERDGAAGYHLARFLGVPGSRAEVRTITEAAGTASQSGIAWDSGSRS